MTQRPWFLLVLPHLLVTLAIILATQAVFLVNSLHADLGLGELGSAFTLSNYVEIVRGRAYANSIVLSLELSAVTVAMALIATFPVAYVLTRMQSRWASVFLAAIVASSFVSVIIKILGMMIIFAANGPVVRFAIWSGLSAHPEPLVGSLPGVVFGYLHLSIGFMAAMLYAVLQTVPRRLEEASLIHGASPWRTLTTVVIPLSLRGVVNACLVQFNLLTGAFVTASVLGGGKVLTVPVLIQRTLFVLSDYGMAGALSAVLLTVVLAVNIATAVIAMPRGRPA